MVFFSLSRVKPGAAHPEARGGRQVAVRLGWREGDGARRLGLAMGSFSTDPDYEGGEWIDGEFYATGVKDRRKRGRMTKEQAMLGVFGSDSEEDGRPQHSRGGPTRDSKKPLADKPLQFVGASSSAGVGSQAASSGAPSGAPSGGAGRPPPAPPKRPSAPASTPSAPEDAPSGPVEKVDKDFASFETFTKGFGAKMLEKMGWTRGAALGRGGQGIVNPLEQKLRPNSMGIGYGGFKETSSKAKLQQKRILHAGGADLEDDDDDDDDDNDGKRPKRRAAQGPAPPPRESTSWKKGTRRELKIKRATDLFQEWENAPSQHGESAGAAVLDLRGPQAKVHTSVRRAIAANAEEAAPVSEHQVLPELKHNVRMLVDLAEVEMQRQHRTLRRERESLQALMRIRDSHASGIKQTTERLSALKAARAAIERCTSTVPRGSASAAATKSVSSSELEQWADRWEELCRTHPAEWRQWKLYEAAVSSAMPHMRRYFQGWRPLEDPSHATAVFARWRLTLCGGSQGAAPLAAARDAYGALVYSTALPPLRSALTNEWASANAAPATALLRAWRPLLPDVLYQELIQAQVLPRLTSELSGWVPRLERPPHPWLLPWQELLPAPGLAALFPQLRHKLAAALGEWSDGDEASGRASIALLSPWREVFDAQSWSGLLVRVVLPKLEGVLRRLVVNPAAQELAPMLCVLAWSELLRTDQLAKLLLQAFFPQWLQTLQLWLSQNPDFSEVSRWYLGWKGLIQERAPLLVHHDGVRERLSTALDLVNSALGAADSALPPPSGAIEDEEPPPPPPPEEEEEETQDEPEHALKSAPQAESRWQKDQDDEPSLRETLERLASMHDLIMMPAGTRHEGKQVFRFGNVPVFFDPDKAVVYARLGSAGFKPCTLTQLVSSATDHTAAK